MLINNMFFHIHDATHKVVKIYIFCGLCCVVATIGSLNHGVTQDAPRALDELHLNLCSWIIQHTKMHEKRIHDYGDSKMSGYYIV